MTGARIFPFLALMLAADFQPTQGRPAGDLAQTVVTGSWGGPRVGLVLDASGGRLEYDCATGGIEQPLRLDGQGRFSATGHHIAGAGGPERVGYVPPRSPASYSGRVEGDTMTLLVRIPSLGVEIGPLALRRNAQPMLVRCL
ncbi:MAG: hypothetical protein M3177_03710 [Pseudomonadota bacterium]|nr:hypothetical protein [Pseudomonadota bacterium]